MSNCITCGADLPAGRKYCNHSCRAKTTNAARKTKTCLNCNKLITKTFTYCNNTCYQEYKYKTDTKPRIERGEISERNVLKRSLYKELGKKCSCCGIDSWMGVDISLELDHIDGNASNNLPSNLRLLCPNCHSITDSWKGRNKGNGRKARGLPLN